MSRSQLATKLPPIEAKSYDSFSVTPLTGSFGALIENIQIADAIDNDALFEDLRQAWLDYQVLFFRDQELTPDQHLKLGEQFGEIQQQGYAPSLEGHPGVWVQEYPDLYEGIVADIDHPPPPEWSEESPTTGRGMDAGASAVNAGMPHQPSTNAHVPPSPASRRLSVSTSFVSCPRSAPRADRTASS